MISRLMVLPVLFFACLYGGVDFSLEQVIQSRKQETQRTLERSEKHAQFYQLEEGEPYRDITQELINSEYTRDDVKAAIIEQKRTFLVFNYPSDGNQVKGYISFTPDYESAPLLVFLRGGNRVFGLMNPATAFTCIKIPLLGRPIEGVLARE